MNHLGLNDVLTFGRHKGKAVRDILVSDVSYCCWLREQRKTAGQPRAFDIEVNGLIDVAILGDKSLRKKFPVWNIGNRSIETAPEEAVSGADHTEDEQDVEVVVPLTREQRYAGEWGAW